MNPPIALHRSSQRSRGNPEERAEWPFATRLALLLDTRRDPDTGRRYTYEAIARGIWQQSRVRLTPAHLSKLKLSQQPNPTARTLVALAAFFGVPISYFTGSDTEAAKDLILRSTLEAPLVREIALLSADLDPDAQRVMRQMAEALRRRPAS